MLAFHSDAHSLALPPGHRFPQSKYRLLREAIEAAPGLIRLLPAEAATEGELLLAHTPSYVEAVLQGHLSASEQREIGFPWSPSMAERSRRSVGASIAAARAALEEGVAANLAGGTHHAYADKGSGYCVFNDVAVAARLMQAEWHRRHGHGRAGLRVLVIDLDVHQGNGTASIFREDDSVFTFSMHGAKNFPFRKEASSLDVDLPDGCGDEPYLAALDEALDKIWQRLDARPPGLAFYLAGADPHEGDRLGRLKLSTAGLLERDHRVLQALRARRIPVALSMAGGYGRDLATTVAVQVNTLSEAARSWSLWRTPAMKE
ncbi:histone deacetylase [Pelomonas sp. V22]|uniref:histone deacetylase family protein n=1 Tax=Pelomonas sp. V22 TaxID=2822139 RepID=UPI0024A8F9D5|nr:histone deacetylase [Pelomonas sp. V22]MDI4633862.1 histone deacetylase [Pelomonas sp. V22]